MISSWLFILKCNLKILFEFVFNTNILNLLSNYVF